MIGLINIDKWTLIFGKYKSLSIIYINKIKVGIT